MLASAYGKPRWEHDCDRCKYIATVWLEGHTYDIWTCEYGGHLNWIARCSDEESDYASYSKVKDDRTALGYVLTMESHGGITPYVEAIRLGIAAFTEKVLDEKRSGYPLSRW